MASGKYIKHTITTHEPVGWVGMEKRAGAVSHASTGQVEVKTVAVLCEIDGKVVVKLMFYCCYCCYEGY